MKRLYTIISSLPQATGTSLLYPINTTTSTMPWANASFAQQPLLVFLAGPSSCKKQSLYPGRPTIQHPFKITS
ncbi:MAG: hypothetical protein ACXWC7_12675 [Chitinophagaceae bacterium]